MLLQFKHLNLSWPYLHQVCLEHRAHGAERPIPIQNQLGSQALPKP